MRRDKREFIIVLVREVPEKVMIPELYKAAKKSLLVVVNFIQDDEQPRKKKDTCRRND